MGRAGMEVGQFRVWLAQPGILMRCCVGVGFGFRLEILYPFLRHSTSFYSGFYYSMRTREMRKPMLSSSRPNRDDGSRLLRCADRQYLARLFQPPPRSTRNSPVEAPAGSITLPPGYHFHPLPSPGSSPSQSEHHSHTLPCMS
jgi:hypothetical protein